MVLAFCRRSLTISLCFNLLVRFSLMLNLFGYSLLSLALVSLLSLASLLISEGVLLDREEVSAYECGFEHVSYSRLPFSFRYFFLTLIFLIFDIEVVFLLFLPRSLFVTIRVFPVLLYSFLFIVVLTLRLVYEWKDGRLEWLI